MFDTGWQRGCAKVAESLALKPESVAVAIHRLRRRYSELVRAEVSRTVSSPDEVEAEFKYLIEIMTR